MATPEELKAQELREQAAAEQRARNAASRKGIVDSITGVLKAPWEGAAPPEGPTAADFRASEAAGQRAQAAEIQQEQEAAKAVEVDALLRERETTADRQRNAMPRPPAAAVQPVDEDAKKAAAGKAGSEVTSFTRSGTQLRDETLKAEELARQSIYEAAVEKARIESEYAGQHAELVDTLAANVKEADDEVMQLWNAANERQTRKMQAVEAMIDEGRRNLADPTAFFGSNKAAAGFGAGMAVAAGHLASALGGGPNTALRIIDKAIERQLRADEFNISQATIRDQQALNLLDKWRQLTKDQVEARTLAKINLIQQAEFKLEAQAQRMNSEMAKQNLAAVKSALLTQKADLMRQYDDQQKTSFTKQVTKLIPLAVQDREERLAAQQAAAAPQTSAVQTETGTPSALVSALGKRATFDTRADVTTQEEGGQFQVPASIASPELLQEQGVPLREVSAGEIFNTAADMAEGSERDKIRAGGQAVLDAGREELQALWASGVTDPVSLEAAWRQSEVLQEAFPDPRDLTPKTREQEHELGGVLYYEVKPPPKKLTGESYSEALATIARGNNVLPDLDRLEGEVDDLRRALGGATRRADGSIDFDRLDPELRARVLDYNHQMNEVFSVVRTMNKSGALQGPGEAQLFRDMSFIPDKVDQIVDLLLEGGNMKSALRTQRMMVREFVDISPGIVGLKNSNAMMGDPDDIGTRLRANRTK